MEVREELLNVLSWSAGMPGAAIKAFWAYKWDWISLALQMFLMGFKMRCVL